GDVAKNIWIAGLAAFFNASQEVSMSDFTARANAITDEFFIVSAIIFTDSKSPVDEAGKPASILSTPKRSNCLAISSFSSLFRFTPGDCLTLRKVVLKICILVILTLPFFLFHRFFDKRH